MVSPPGTCGQAVIEVSPKHLPGESLDRACDRASAASQRLDLPAEPLVLRGEALAIVYGGLSAAAISSMWSWVSAMGFPSLLGYSISRVRRCRRTVVMASLLLSSDSSLGGSVRGLSTRHRRSIRLDYSIIGTKQAGLPLPGAGRANPHRDPMFNTDFACVRCRQYRLNGTATPKRAATFRSKGRAFDPIDRVSTRIGRPLR